VSRIRAGVPQLDQPEFATIEDLRAYLATNGGGAPASAEDDLLAQMLAAAHGRFLELRPDRTLAPLPPKAEDDPVAMTFTLPAGRRLLVVPDLREVEEIKIDGTVYTGRVTLLGRPGRPAWRVKLVDWRPRILDAESDLDHEVEITGRWGPAGGPEPQVKEAVIVWVARVYQERAARWSDARTDIEGGVQTYFRAIPASIAATINALQVPGV
jgi:hypothetical protein